MVGTVSPTLVAVTVAATPPQHSASLTLPRMNAGGSRTVTHPVHAADSPGSRLTTTSNVPVVASAGTLTNTMAIESLKIDTNRTTTSGPIAAVRPVTPP